MYPPSDRERCVPDIFDEVEEELRAERAQKFLTQYAGVILGSVLLVVAAVAGWQGWRWHQAKQDEQAGAVYIAAMVAAGQPGGAGNAAALNEFDALAQQAPQGYRALARLQAAALQAQNGHLQVALALWDAVAGDSGADPLLRNLATLLWAQHQVEAGDPAIVRARLEPLANARGPWRALAQEQLALLDLRQGHADQAKQTLTALRDAADAPVGVKERATALLARLGA